jgi:hypothetical protein
MRVRCINDQGWYDADTNKEEDGPKYGDVCTVIDVLLIDGLVYYVLYEWPLSESTEGWQRDDCFITIREDLDETIIHADKIKEDSYV